MSTARFTRNLRGQSTYRCAICKKLTRDTGHDEAGLGLCLRCLYESYLENAEADYGKESPQYRDAEKRLKEITK